MTARILPAEVVQAVDLYIDKELDDARRYENREPLDYSGCWSLHKLAADIYAAGWRDGEQAEAERDRGQRRRDREANQ